MMEETDLLLSKSQNKKNEINKHLSEIESYLQSFGISAIDANYLVDKLINIIENNPACLFHYDSHHWAKYLAEASGLIGK